MSKANAASVKPGNAEKKPAGVLAFYSQKEHVGPRIELWVNTNETPGMPDFDGTLADKRVGAYFRQSRKGNFLAVFDSTKRSDGQYDQLGTARVVTNVAGIPKFALSLQGGKTFWAEVSQRLPEALLVQCGLDLAMQAQKRKAHAEKKLPLSPDAA